MSDAEAVGAYKEMEILTELPAPYFFSVPRMAPARWAALS